MSRGRSVMTARTPRSRQVPSSSSVLTVQTWISRPESASRRPNSGFLRSVAMPGPAIQSSSTSGRSTGQWRACSNSITSRTPGARRRTRLRAT